MSHGNIRRIPRSCVSYHPGHQVHWIHAKRRTSRSRRSLSSSRSTTTGMSNSTAMIYDSACGITIPRGCSRSLIRQATMAYGSPGSMRCSHRARADGYSISLPSIT